jgi:cysteine desulfurase
MAQSEQLIYLDNNATTRIDSRVLEVMIPYLTDEFGNAASRSHRLGWRAAGAVDEARAAIARALGASGPKDIVFTSGATESVNLAIKGIRPGPGQDHIVTSQIEHKAVLDSCKALEREGRRVTYLPVDANGLVDLNRLADAITGGTYLVSIMTANNETGTIQDVAAIGALCRAKGVLFHTDATQAVGKIPFDVAALNVDLASFAAHKLYGPKGVGALYVDRAAVGGHLVAEMDGGGHESGYRSGTLNVPGIAGFAKAMEICVADMASDSARLIAHRNALHEALTSRIEDIHLNGHPLRCLPGVRNFSFAGIDADSLLLELSDIALSSGSACTSAQTAPSHVLKALGLDDEMAQASVRFSIGRFNTAEEIAYAAECCVRAVAMLRAMSPLMRRRA